MEQVIPNKFSIEAIRPGALERLEPGKAFPNVLSMPVSCPACSEQWILLTDAQVALEIEMGLTGEQHLKLLAEALIEECQGNQHGDHFRTDGDTVWVPKP